MKESGSMRLGRYEVEAELGRGAMGVVYLATDPTIGRKVAIKTLIADPGRPDVDALKKRFAREARAAGVLTHPGIVTVHDVGEDLATGNPYMAMEYLDGVNLATMLRSSGKLPVAQTLDVLRQIASGLDYAHARGVVHRDIKPANIVMLPTGQVKITDFGIAKLDTGAELTQAGHFLGTPSYTAPEQLAGRKVDGSADVYSLGVMAYEMLCGRRPFQGESFTTLAYQIMNVEPPEAPDLPREINAAFKRALAKDPRSRPATATEMVNEIAASLDRSGATRMEETRLDPRRLVPPAPPRAAPPKRSSILTLVLLGVAFTLGIGGLTALMISSLQGTAPAPATPRPSHAADPSRTARPRPSQQKPQPRETTPRSPPTPSESPSTPPVFRPGDPQNPHVTVNLTIAGIASGAATLVLDGQDFWTQEFTSRPAFPGGAKGSTAESQGYLKRRVELPWGSHRIELRIDGGGRTLRTPLMTVDLEPRQTLELKASVQDGRLSAQMQASPPGGATP